jgi:two-component system CheB/CheR fusion protein
VSDSLFSTGSFMPHGHCYLWRPDVLWLNVVSDGLIAAAYYVIPLFLIHLVRKRHDLAFNWIFVMFAGFILACGTTHVLEIVTVWNPQYGLQGLVKLATAAVSAATALALIPLMPRALALPSGRMLADANKTLAAEVEERRRVEVELRVVHADLERLVAERTRELAAANEALRREVHERSVTASKLGEERERYRVTLASIGDGVIATDIVGAVEFMNPVAEALTGWRAADAIGRSVGAVFDIRNEYTRQPVQSPIVRVLREGATVGLANHTMLHARDGRELPIDDSGAPIRNAAGEIVGAVLVFHDIVERRKAEAIQARHAAVVEGSADAIVAKDLEGRVTAWNHGAERLFGYAAHEMIGRSITTIFPPERAGELASLLGAVRRGECVEHYETERVRKDGRRIHVSISVSPIKDQMGNVIGAAKIGHDITARKLAEAEVRRWEHIFKHAGWAVAVTSPTNRFTLVNPAYARMHGYGPGELDGKTVDVTTAPEDRAKLAAFVRDLDGSGSGTAEILHCRRDGSTFAALVTATTFKDADGEVLYRAATVQDISTQKEAEARIEAAYAQAQAANRMKDEFLATLSHELRTPMNAILGHADLLREGDVPQGEERDSYEVIHRNAIAQTRLIDDLLDISRIMAGKIALVPAVVSLDAVLAEAAAAVEVAARAKNVRLRLPTDGAREPVLVRGDAGRLGQVLWNLLANAVKFTPSEGSVQVALVRRDETAEVSVTDTGVGIEAVFLPHVFDRFAQEDGSLTRRYGGLGLGLAIARHIAEMHGGTLSATSAGKGRGATFTLRLPAPEALQRHDPPGAAIAETARGVASLAGRAVLIVDDHEDTRRLMARTLEVAGLRPFLAASAAEARRVLAERAVDLLVCDIGMPDEDGYALIAHLRAQERALRRAPCAAVAVTAFARPEDREHALAAGFQVHLAKPVRASDLVATVRSLLEEAPEGDDAGGGSTPRTTLHAVPNAEAPGA